MARKREYTAFVDSAKIGKFQDAMKEVSRRTRDFPRRRKCIVDISSHSGGFEYVGRRRHKIQGTIEGLGQKNYIAEHVYQEIGDATVFHSVGWCNALMAINDLIANGTRPAIYLDKVSAGSSDWFADVKRARAIGGSFFDVCAETHVAMPAGESPALPYLVKSEPPVKSAPIMSGVAIGYQLVEERIPDVVKAGDRIIGVYSSGLHSNGSSVIISRAKKLKRGFFTMLPHGKTFGEEALVRTTSYVALVEALLDNKVRVRKFLPGTGDGVAKLGRIRGDLTYYITDWPEMPVLFQFLRELGMTMYDLLTTFNCGIGYYIFVPKRAVDQTLEVGEKAGYKTMILGEVREGARGVHFGPEHGLWLPPPH